MFRFGISSCCATHLSVDVQVTCRGIELVIIPDDDDDDDEDDDAPDKPDPDGGLEKTEPMIVDEIQRFLASQEKQRL